MDTTLSAIREILLQDRSWASSGSTFNKRVRIAINRSLKEIAGDVPEAILPEDYKTRIYAPIDSASSDVNATISATADNKVLKFVIAATSTWAPKTDGTWDGLMHLEVTTADDSRVRRRQSHEWWSTTVGDTTTYYVSIDKPWRNASDTGLAFKIYQPEFFLPGNTIRVLDPLRIYSTSGSLLHQISGGTARRSDLPDYQHKSQGSPELFYRTRHFKIPSPKTAPRIGLLQDKGSGDQGTAISTSDWTGPVQEGKFRFCYTFVWGRADEEFQDSPVGMRDPIWESAPSPVSDVFDHTADGNYTKLTVGGETEIKGYGINIQVDNIDQILDFAARGAGIDVSASPYPHVDPLRYGKSGFRVRIYVIRDDLYADHGPTSGTSPIRRSFRFNQVDSDGRPYLLTEIDPLDINPSSASYAAPQVGSFTWTGSLPVPDRMRPLRKVTGYYAYRMHPAPDNDYDLDMQILRQPVELVHDNDTVPIKQESMSAFLELCLVYMSRMDGVDAASEMKHRQNYNTQVRKLRTQHGDNAGIVSPRPWSVIRRRPRYDKMREG